MTQLRSPRSRKTLESLAFETLAQALDPKAPENDPSNVWQPHPGPQELALACEADELYYGGQAGGGKTDLLLGAAITCHWKSVIFRREYKQLTGIVERSRELLGPRGYNANDCLWRLPSGRWIEFGACEHPNDVQKWQGRDHDLKGFDEICHFLESQYLFLSGWNRSTRRGQRCRTIATGNPPTTAEGEWVIRRWAPWLDKKHPHPAKPGELRWFVRKDGEDVEVDGPEPFEHTSNGRTETLHPRSRTFIPAALSDNPSLVGTDYEAVLDAMPEPLRTQLKHGDFGVHHEDDPYQVIPSRWLELAHARWTADAPGAMTAIGVDVARGGGDKTTIAPRHGAWFAPVLAYPGKTTPDGPSVATLVMQAIAGKAIVNVDVIGIGASAYDHLKPHIGARAVPINFSERSEARDKSGKLGFANRRAEAYWKFREMLDPLTGQSIALQPDDELDADLCAVRWTLQLRGIQMEAKDDIAERLGRSPDKGDACVLASFLQPTKLFSPTVSKSLTPARAKLRT